MAPSRLCWNVTATQPFSVSGAIGVRLRHQAAHDRRKDPLVTGPGGSHEQVERPGARPDEHAGFVLAHAIEDDPRSVFRAGTRGRYRSEDADTAQKIGASYLKPVRAEPGVDSFSDSSPPGLQHHVVTHVGEEFRFGAICARRRKYFLSGMGAVVVGA